MRKTLPTIVRTGVLQACLAALLLVGFAPDRAMATDSGVELRFDTYIYPRKATRDDPRDHYFIALLREVLKRTEQSHGPYRLHPGTHPLPTNSRDEQELERRSLTIFWKTATKDREARFASIPVPLLRGLLGYRIFIIDRANAQAFARVRTLDDLSRFTAIQGHDWEDSTIMQQAGLPVSTLANYGLLFDLVAKGRVDYFPRGVSEAYFEVKVQQDIHPTLTVEETLCLHYPFPVYFYFNKQDVELRKRVEAGLASMLVDGSLRALFNKHFGQVLEQAALDERRIFRLENRLLPPGVPLHDRSLWYDPQFTLPQRQLNR